VSKFQRKPWGDLPVIIKYEVNTMRFVWFVVVAVASWFFGIIGWAQIIGSIQHAKERSRGATIYTIVIWLVLFGLATLAVVLWLKRFWMVYLGGMAVALIRMLTVGRIE
jgi:hypothetical protein